ncbi:MAG: hypothetical protein KF893_23900 [Caldilineaceae bacterium]|nr:hypothetical protein [Caldilineaceae bacterium]
MSADSFNIVTRFHFTAAWNGWQQDLRIRVTIWIQAVLVFGLSASGVIWLLRQLDAWQADSAMTLHTNLWMTLVLLWAALGALALLGALQAGFGSDEARLLMTLPIAHAPHFRILFGMVLLEQTGVLLVLITLGAGVALILTLGTSGVGWLLLLLMGGAAAIWLVLMAVILILRYGLPHPRRLLWSLLLGLILVEGAGLLFDVEGRWARESEGMWSSPLPATLTILTLLGIGLGPLAGWCGRQYVTAFQILEGRGARALAFTLPGLRGLLSPLIRQRNLTASLLSRAILEQNRHPLALPRLAVLPVYLLLFGLLRPRLHALGFSESSAAAATGALMGGLILVEYGLAYALSGEGARLALYLTAPLRTGNLLRAKLLAVLPPVMIISWLAVFAMTAGTGTSTADLILAAGTTTLFLLGVTGFVVWAGVADVDLDALPSGTADLLLQEELPITPRRLQLLGIGFAVLAVAIGLLWWLPLGQVLAVAGILCGGLLWMGWRLGQSGMKSLVA